MLRILFVANLLVVSLITSSALAQLASELAPQPLTSIEKDAYAKLCDGYIDNMRKLARYGVACEVEYTRIDKDINKSKNRTDWYLSCVDANIAFRRHDKIGFSSSDVDDFGVVTKFNHNAGLVISPELIVEHKGASNLRVIFQSDSSKLRADNTDNASSERVRIFPTEVFDVWDLPFCGEGCLLTQYYLPLKYGSITELLKNRFILVDYQEAPHILVGTEIVPLQSTPDVYLQIIWDKRSGMPVEVKAYQKRADAPKDLFSIRTNWAHWQNTWIPLEVIVNSGTSSSKETHQFTLHWAKEFPQSTFEQRTVDVRAHQLKQLLLKEEIPKTDFKVLAK